MSYVLRPTQKRDNNHKIVYKIHIKSNYLVSRQTSITSVECGLWKK
jgi:hypothetical protein